MDGYEVKVYYSPADWVYLAEIVEFPGCIIHGDTPEEALAKLHEVKAGWIAAMQEAGHPIPPPKYAQKAAA